MVPSLPFAAPSSKHAPTVVVGGVRKTCALSFAVNTVLHSQTVCHGHRRMDRRCSGDVLVGWLTASRQPSPTWYFCTLSFFLIMNSRLWYGERLVKDGWVQVEGLAYAVVPTVVGTG